MNGIEIRHEVMNDNYDTVVKFLWEVDECIIPILSCRVDIEQYARKISKYADMFNVWYQEELIGNAAVYLNNQKEGFVTSFVIKPKYQKLGYGKKLWECVCQEAEKRGIKEISLNVHQSNNAAKAFYKSQGFAVECENGEWIKMKYTGGEYNKCSKISVPSLSIMVTEACTLRCKLCLAFVPYYKKHFQLALQDAKIVFKRYFAIVNHVDKVSITGGEPLLNPQLNLILKELYQYSSQIIKEIILITNGTVEIEEELLRVLKLNKKIKVIVNNYGSLSVYAEKNYKRLCDEKINCILYTEDNRYGWIDCRDHSLKHKTGEECEKQASQCSFFQGKKYVVNRGKLYTCTRAAYRIQENIISYTEEAYIDLLKEDESVQFQRDKLIKLINARSTISCAYCDGLTENSKKYIAAEQL